MCKTEEYLEINFSYMYSEHISVSFNPAELFLMYLSQAMHLLKYALINAI